MAPIAPNPTIIIAQAAGSGAPLGLGSATVNTPPKPSLVTTLNGPCTAKVGSMFAKSDMTPLDENYDAWSLVRSDTL